MDRDRPLDEGFPAAFEFDFLARLPPLGADPRMKVVMRSRWERTNQ